MKWMLYFPKKIVGCLAIMLFVRLQAQTIHYSIKDTIFVEHFNHQLDNWMVEKAAADSEIVKIQEQQLCINTYGGATVWYKQPLQGNYMIQLKRSIRMGGEKNDRLSDCNFFWMATDSLQNKFFKRTGGFKEYDSLSMYYVGFGGNYNTTTRCRKYTPKGDRGMIGEYKDSAHLLKANKTYLITILVKNGTTAFLVDGEPFFYYQDPLPLSYGYFGIRSTRSRQFIDDVLICSIE